MDVTAFVLSQLPRRPARVLEVGCGHEGTLARAVADAGYDVLAIDPAAPQGEIFRRIKLEEVEDDERFDAVVACRSLHHITDLGPALDKVRSLLPGSGRLVVDEFAWDRVDGPTAEWFYGQRRAVAAARGESVPPSLAECSREWEDEHVGLHGFDAMRRELDARFRERLFAWMPDLYRYLDGVATQSLERTLIEADVIQPIGWRYVGEPL